MDGLREPMGDLPPEVYVRRRIVAALGVILVVVVLGFLIFSPSGDKKPATSTDKGTSSVTPPPSVSPSPTPDLADARACTSADVLLTVTPTPFTVPAGSPATFDVSIKQQGSAPCLLDTDADGTSLVVWSGGESNRDMYFDSTYCEADTTITSRQMLLQPGAEEKMSLAWGRNRIGEGCTEGASAGPGFYWAKLTVAGVEAEAAQFELAG